MKPGTRRKYLRVNLRSRVYVTYNRTPHELYTENISEGGMYIKTKEPFPAGPEVEISLSLEAGSHIRVKGTVVHAKHPVSEMVGHPPVMGIEFKGVRDDDRKTLRDFVTRTSTQDIPEGIKGALIKPSLAND